MPYEIVPVEHGKYMVLNPLNGRVHSYATNLENAKKQAGLLYGIASGVYDHNPLLRGHFRK